MACTTTTSVNKLDFMPGTAEQSLMPSFEWRSLGAAFALGDSPSTSASVKAAKLSGRCSFVVRQGFDPIDQSSTGRVVEGAGDAGITLRSGSSAISLSAGNIRYRSGLDDPLAAAQADAGEASVPSLKATLAKEYRPDCFAAVSYDLRQQKPEFSLAWAGDAFTERAALVVHADPVLRTYKMAASVAFQGKHACSGLCSLPAGVCMRGHATKGCSVLMAAGAQQGLQQQGLHGAADGWSA